MSDLRKIALSTTNLVGKIVEKKLESKGYFLIENDPIAYKVREEGAIFSNLFAESKSPETPDEIIKGLNYGYGLNYGSIELVENEDPKEYTFSVKVNQSFKNAYADVIVVLGNKVEAKKISGSVVIVIADKVEVEKIECETHLLLLAQSVAIKKIVSERGFIYSPRAEYNLEGNATEYINENFNEFPDVKDGIINLLKSHFADKIDDDELEEVKFAEKLFDHLTF